MIEEAEKEEISVALRQVSYNRSRAAKLLGISRSTLYDKLKRYQVAKQKPQDTPQGVRLSGHL
jgi:DNA-binding NtrC family response regulator